MNKTNIKNNLITPDEGPGTEEEKLYKKASRRAGFKIHLMIFLLVEILFWVVWFFLFRGGQDATSAKALNALLLLSIVWLIIVIAHYLMVYKWNKSLVEKELEKLKKENKAQREELEKLKKGNGEQNNKHNI